MAKLDTVMRCITSRQICFPLIFSIATISLMVTLVQFSFVDVPRVGQRWKIDDSKNMRHSRNLWQEWMPEEEHEKATIAKGIEVEKYEDSFPRIRLPVLKDNLKIMSIKDKKRRKTETEKSIFTDDDVPAKAEQEKKVIATTTVAEDLRHLRRKHTNDSEYDDGKYSPFQENLEDIIYLDDIDHFNRNSVVKMEPLPKQTRGVVIVTNYRSGSTFLGQLFNQHPQAFYTFEPLFPFGSNCSFQAQKRVKTLQDMLTCTFPSMKSLYEDIGVDPKSNRVHSSCMRNNFCFRYNHEHLCTKDICPRGDTDSCTRCGPVDLALVNNKCRSRKVSVIKVIKLCFIKSLAPLFQDPSLDLKIIHLVRDPRGVASSRLKIHPDWDVASNIVATCQRQAANVRAGRNDHTLSNRYKLVRYEDLAMRPFELAKEIYDFVGLPFVDSVKDWIAMNTKSSGDSNTDSRAKRLGLHKNTKYTAEKDPYSTQRDSTSAMQAWRTHLSFDTIGKIQKRCFEALRSLGYKDFKTQHDLLNLNLTAIL